MKTPYEILGVSPNATDEEIQAAYHSLMQKYHPDKYQDSDLADLAKEKAQQINAAYSEIRKMRAKGGARRGLGDSFETSGGFDTDDNLTRYAQVRVLLNQNRVAEAESMLRTIPNGQTSGEWHYLMGSVLYKRGYFVDAQRMFDRACELEPYNTEYQAARDQLRTQSSNYGNEAGGYRRSNSSSCDCCTSLICADCCCEMMGGDLIACC